MEAEKLKECPFCGGDAVISDHYNGGTGNSWSLVRCSNCKISQNTRNYYTRKKAVENWNNRTTD